MTRVLLVDDDQELCETLELDLAHRGYAVRTCTSAADALGAMHEGDFDVVVTDLNMRGQSGLELCERIVADRPDIPVVVLTAFGSLETAVGAIRAGAYDFLSKPIQLAALAIAVDRAAAHRNLHQRVRRLEREISMRPGGADIVGASSALRGVLDIVDRVAPTEATVLVTGESGTGKEVIARAIHDDSHRKGRPFVAINCAAVPERLLESELFGHVRGAFTGAHSTEAGLLVSANGGTMFLDEIGDMPLSLQPKLLRALQERVIRPVGSSRESPIDVRIVAATNRDLETAIEDGRFREDLYYRLAVVQIALPPLRARAADILPLAHHFLALFAGRSTDKPITGMTPAAAERLMAYPWPGNVRELRNCIERAIALARFDQLSVDDLPEKVREHKASHVLLAADDPSELVSLEQLERTYIARVMQVVAGNKSAAARILGLDRKRLYRMLQRLGLVQPP
jgi:two-component system response regulator HydG